MGPPSRVRYKGVLDEEHGTCISRMSSRPTRLQARPPTLERVFDICVEKNFQLLDGMSGRNFRGRAVYQGDTVKDSDGTWAIFQELQSCASTMAASKVADFY